MAAGRNSDGSYDAVGSGGFGKDYHGQDAFGEHFGGHGIGGSHFGGFEEGHFSDEDELGEGHYTERYKDYGQVTQTEAPDTSAFEPEEEASSGMRDTLRGVNEETAENSNTGSMDTGLRIGGIEENEAAKEKMNNAKQKMDHLEQSLNLAEKKRKEALDSLDKLTEDLSKGIDYFDKSHNISLAKDSESLLMSKTVSGVEKVAKAYGFGIDEETKAKMANPSTAVQTMRDVLKGVRDLQERIHTKAYNGVKSEYEAAKAEYETIKDNYDKRLESSFTDKMKEDKPKTEDKPGPNMSKATPEDKEKMDSINRTLIAGLEKAEGELNEVNKKAEEWAEYSANSQSAIYSAIDGLEDKSITGRISNAISHQEDKITDRLVDLAKAFGYKDFDLRRAINNSNKKSDALRKVTKTLFERKQAEVDNTVEDAQRKRDKIKSMLDSHKSSTTDKTKTSFTDKMKPSTSNKTTEAKPGPNMSKATVGESDYLTKANKDSTKELPKEGPSRNDFGNHAADTFKGVIDRVADNTTAKALGIQSLEDFAKENGYDPNKLSTTKAYRSYQNKQIMKAIPSLMKKVGSYIIERVKDVVDPSQLPERIRNTIARYNAATLIGAAILSIQSGAGLQASIDQALTMVDPEDQPAVSDYLEDVLNDEGTVNDLGNAFDDALAPEQNSDTAELDESIVNIGRKDNTDYSDFNAGLGTTSDADVKVFIARNVKADPILRRMINKMGK